MAPQIGPERVRALLHYSPETGEFTWIAKAARNTVIGASAGRLKSSGYIEIGVDGHLHGAHRLAWIVVNGPIPAGTVIDHINGVKNDNRIANLRAVSVSLNNRNRHVPAGRNPLVGVSFDIARRKWRADIKVGNKCKTLGRFDSQDKARAAYLAARDAIWPELADTKTTEAS